MADSRWADDALVEQWDLTELNDTALVERARAGEDRAIDVLLARYRNFARSKARSYFLVGSDKDDVVQEGMIGLFKAVRDFDTSQSTPFRAFADLCITRQIMSAIKSANRHKHQPLNTSVSLDSAAPEDDASLPVAARLPGPASSDPAELVISAHEIEALRDSMRNNLTQLEGDVLQLYMEGKSYEQIAGVLGNHVKSIDNALQRIKRKLQRHINQRNALSSG